MAEVEPDTICGDPPGSERPKLGHPWEAKTAGSGVKVIAASGPDNKSDCDSTEQNEGMDTVQSVEGATAMDLSATTKTDRLGKSSEDYRQKQEEPRPPNKLLAPFYKTGPLSPFVDATLHFCGALKEITSVKSKSPISYSCL